MHCKGQIAGEGGQVVTSVVRNEGTWDPGCRRGGGTCRFVSCQETIGCKGIEKEDIWDDLGCPSWVTW